MKFKNHYIILSALLAYGTLMTPAPVFGEETIVLADEDDVELTATFKSGIGGTFTDGTNTVTVEYTEHRPLEAATIPNIKVRDGYTFRGWSVDGRGLYTNSQLSRLVLTGAHEIEAQYARASFTVTFEAGEHGTLSEDSVKTILVDDPIGQTPVVTADPGYKFIGWKYEDRLYTAEEAAVLLVPASDITLTAVYEPVTLTVTVSAGDDGSFESGQDVILSDIAYGTALADLALPEPTAEEGYEFKGWDMNVNDTVVKEDMTITALWEKKPVQPEPEKPVRPESKPEKKPSTKPTTPNTAAETGIVPAMTAAMTSLAVLIWLHRKSK